MESWIKISGETYYARECEVQLSMEKWAIIYLSLDLSAHPEYYDDFIDLYENRRLFGIGAVRFSANMCRIKTMDIDFGKKMSVSIRCEQIDAYGLSERRNGIIDDILGETTFVATGV